MKRIRIPWMLEVLNAIEQLDLITEGKPLKESWFFLYQAKNQIEAVFGQSPYSRHLRVSRDLAGELHTEITSILGDGTKNDRALDDFEVWSLKFKRDAFKPVFTSEVSTLPSFLVVEKEGYDINLLIEDGVKLFPATIAARAPEAVRDAMEVGKAIAFELPTAAGFHIFRVVEAVVKRYWDHVSAGKDRPKLETLGTYAVALEDNKFGDAKVWESLKQLGKLHRNPLIHPEVILDVGEEIEILGISRSLVGAMLKVMPDVPTTTTTALPTT
ncbi:hypothetical protein [Bradyrhizobium sp. 199]|uniref:hypothetical protein n=1 Tax=Bradyrhizobium sp. 199 TaxID=2782664 RepID=UPI001FFAAD24|nr:hypothetical protein [Bradyrhizobium sp. 199]MCK1358931.1 hypothetical protein [Bradyrhizobium sp. 199]